MKLKSKAKLVLEDGSIFEGYSLGAQGEASGEIVFNTSITGYQEILTDPSYKGQLVTMTYPLIGNYGVNKDDVESIKPWVEGFIVREASNVVSNWRAGKSLQEYLLEHNIVGIEGVDTRFITRKIRQEGAMRTVVSSQDLDDNSLREKVKNVPSLIGRDLVKEVTCRDFYDWGNAKEDGFNIVVLDCGVKFNILRLLTKYGCRVKVVPAYTSAQDILKLKPEGIMLSNGPGDPAAVDYVIKTVHGLVEHTLNCEPIPIMGICLGHQMLALALGGRTYKLKFGHHGGNHPVKDLRTGRISITVQNHGFCVEMDSLDRDNIEITHINLNDNTLEGIRYKHKPIFSVQFHPEAGPGPHDGEYLFKEFIGMVKEYKGR